MSKISILLLEPVDFPLAVKTGNTFRIKVRVQVAGVSSPGRGQMVLQFDKSVFALVNSSEVQPFEIFPDRNVVIGNWTLRALRAVKESTMAVIAKSDSLVQAASFGVKVL